MKIQISSLKLKKPQVRHMNSSLWALAVSCVPSRSARVHTRALDLDTTVLDARRVLVLKVGLSERSFC